LRFRFNLCRKINLAVFGVNEIPLKSLCKFVDDCGKKSREIEGSKFKKKERRLQRTLQNKEDTEKIEAEKQRGREKSAAPPESRAEDQSRE
jgi:hypothetical protein